MRSILHEAARPAWPTSPAPAQEEPVSVVAALIEALTNPERYSVVARDGELFIRPIARPAYSFYGS